MTREDVLREFDFERDDIEDIVTEMADRIVALEAALAAAPKVTVLDRWAVVDKNGEIVANESSHSKEAAVWHDENFPETAPHTVRRVALLDEPTTRGEG